MIWIQGVLLSPLYILHSWEGLQSWVFSKCPIPRNVWHHTPDTTLTAEAKTGGGQTRTDKINKNKVSLSASPALVQANTQLYGWQQKVAGVIKA